MCTIVGDLLAENGYQVHLFCTEQASPERLRRLAPKVIVLHIPLEEAEPSWQLLAHCLLDPRLKRTSFIIYSAVAGELTRFTTALPQGRSVTIPKPFGHAEFLALVRQAAERAA